ncbi:ATP-binding protein [Streptomyces sp. NPDC050617]|uniref:ATP-binding protein n=1 Tax=Streptomyces sp. NPDC050617 TaxID=3154628 RepID=UPI0034411B45
MTDRTPRPPPRPVPLDWGLAMGLGMPRFAARRLTARERSLGPVRAFVRHTLTRWDLTAALDDVTLVACELAANALRHALRGEHAADCGWLALAHTRHTVLCAATDPDPRFPLGPPHRDGLAEDGWGLTLVRALSDTWGWHRLPGGGGKSVWAKIPA